MSTLHVDYDRVFACYGVKIFKNTPLNNFKRGGRGWVGIGGPEIWRWIRLWYASNQYQSFTLYRHTVPSFETIDQKELR